MKLPLALALLFAFSVSGAVNGQDSYGPPLTGERLESGRRGMTKALSEDKIHRVELNKAPIREAVDFWIKETRKGGAGWNLVLKLGDDGVREWPPITIHRQEMSSRDFLDEVCKQGGLKWTIELWEKWGLISIVPKPK